MREDNVRKIWSEAELDAALGDLNGNVEEDDGLAFARASLLAAAGAEEAPPAEPRRGGAWRWLAVAAAVVTLVGGLGVAAAVWTPDAPETARPAASLPDLDRPLEPGEFRYTEMRDRTFRTGPDFVGGAQRRTELWIPADPTGVWHRRTTLTNPQASDGRSAGPSPGIVDEYGAGGVFPGHRNHSGEMKPTWNTPFANWLSPDAAFVASLVPDPQKLLKRLQFDTIDVSDAGRGSPHLAGQSLAMARSALETGLLRPDVRSALVEALAAVPGILVVTRQTLPDNRPVTVYVAKDTGLRLFLDPATGRLLAAESSPIPVGGTTTRNEVPRTTPAPPSSVAVPITTTQFPVSRAPDRREVPDAQYSYAITRTSG